MAAARRLTAIIEREDDGYVALCPELDIASEGGTIEDARQNLTEALTLFFETASPSEIDTRFQNVEFFELAGRFRSAEDPDEAKQLGHQMGNIIFGK